MARTSVDACKAPEAAAGAAPTPAMDVYSAGLVLIEMLTGRPLIHQKDTWQALYRIANENTYPQWYKDSEFYKER